MGLDMNLYAKVYVGGRYHKIVDNFIEFEKGWKSQITTMKIPTKHIYEVVYDIGYWRKANQIHKWFVDNVQDGEDDCRQYSVSKEQLLALKKICDDLLKSKDKEEALELLPPCEGFFFGSTNTELDEFWECYWGDLSNTSTIITTALDYIDKYEAYIYYVSSW